MTIGVLRTSLFCLMVGGLGATAAALTRPTVQVNLPVATSVPGDRALSSEQPDEALLERALERPAFRADRRRSSAVYDPTRPVTPDAPPPPAAPKPALALSGIVWGPEPAVVLEGVPGIEGSAVLRRGDSAAGLQVVRIEGERVVIRGMDTTWTLTVRNPWP